MLETRQTLRFWGWSQYLSLRDRPQPTHRSDGANKAVKSESSRRSSPLYVCYHRLLASKFYYNQLSQSRTVIDAVILRFFCCVWLLYPVRANRRKEVSTLTMHWWWWLICLNKSLPRLRSDTNLPGSLKPRRPLKKRRLTYRALYWLKSEGAMRKSNAEGGGWSRLRIERFQRDKPELQLRNQVIET